MQIVVTCVALTNQNKRALAPAIMEFMDRRHDIPGLKRNCFKVGIFLFLNIRGIVLSFCCYVLCTLVTGALARAVIDMYYVLFL